MTLHLLQLLAHISAHFYSCSISILLIDSEQAFVFIISLGQQLTSKYWIQLSFLRSHISLCIWHNWFSQLREHNHLKQNALV